MTLSREALKEAMTNWLQAWNEHDIEGVMALFHDEIVFEHWHGASLSGKGRLRDAWAPWFEDHGGFRFTTEDLIIDEKAQKVLYQWRLDWPSIEKGFEGGDEKRRGVDVVHFKDGKIINKFTYSKTTIEIDGQKVPCRAVQA